MGRRRQKGRSDREDMYVSKKLTRSDAFLSLTGKAPQVLMIFLTKRRMEWKTEGSREGYWDIKNNGEIQFTYEEAKTKFGIGYAVFSRALSQLVERGFIDIAVQGTGIRGAVTKYAISERWRRYGKSDFEAKERKPRPMFFKFPKKPKEN